MAAKDPAYYGIDEGELERRRRWTRTARDQVLFSLQMISWMKQSYMLPGNLMLTAFGCFGKF